MHECSSLIAYLNFFVNSWWTHQLWNGRLPRAWTLWSCASLLEVSIQNSSGSVLFVQSRQLFYQHSLPSVKSTLKGEARFIPGLCQVWIVVFLFLRQDFILASQGASGRRAMGSVLPLIQWCTPHQRYCVTSLKSIGVSLYIFYHLCSILASHWLPCTFKIAEGYDCHILHNWQIDRIARVGFETAKKRRGKLCSVDKANVLEVAPFTISLHYYTI